MRSPADIETADKHLLQQLLGGGVRPAIARRLLEEMRDHRQDIAEGLQAQGLSACEALSLAQQQLGDPSHVLRQALGRPELQHFVSRHRRLSFLVLPVVVYLLLSVLALLLLLAIALPEPVPAGSASPPGFGIAWDVLGLLVEWILPLCTGLAFCVAGRRALVPDHWPMFAIVVVSVVAGCTRITPNSAVLSFPPQDAPRAALAACALLAGFAVFRWRVHRQKGVLS